MARQAEKKVQVCQAIAESIEEWREANKITHSLHQLVSQRVYQLVGGYEDANDSNQLRHDPIYKIACERVPIADAELAGKPTDDHPARESGEQARSVQRCVSALGLAMRLAFLAMA